MILITGATGQLGSLIAKEVLARVPASQVAVSVREPEKAADIAKKGVSVRQASYADKASLEAAFKGADTVMLISGDADVTERIAQHRNAIEAAQKAGVNRIVYTSYLDHDPGSPFPFAAIHGDTESVLKASGLAWTILRPSLYAEMAVPGAKGAAQSGVYATAAPQGRVSYISRADIARVAAVVLTQPGHEGKIYELTGGAALSAADVAATVAHLAGKPVKVQPITIDDYLANVAKFGLPPFLVAALGGAQRAVDAGRMAKVTDAVTRLTGTPPASVEDVLRAALR
jgi:NAD(P)H dehydrogenase (quinone)